MGIQILFICLFVYLFNPLPRICLLTLESREGMEKERARHTDVREDHPSVAFSTHPDQDQTHNLGMCPD